MVRSSLGSKGEHYRGILPHPAFTPLRVRVGVASMLEAIVRPSLAFGVDVVACVSSVQWTMNTRRGAIVVRVRHFHLRGITNTVEIQERSRQNSSNFDGPPSLSSFQHACTP